MGSPNFLQMLRLKNIFEPQYGNDLPSQGGFGGNMTGFPEGFGPTPPPPPMFNTPAVEVQPPGTSMSASMPAQTASDRVAQEMARLYTPETQMTEKFNELLGNYPQQQDYKPSMLRRIGGALTAVGGSFDGKGGFRFNPNAVETGMGLMNEPINKKLNDWKNQIGPTYQAASLERTNNANERTMAYQTVAQQLRAEADEERAKKNDRDAAIRQQRADVYEFKARNPNLKLIMTKGGNVQAFNPADGTTKDTGIPTGSLTEADKMSLQQENALEQIGARTQGQKEVETLRQGGRQDIAETRGWKLGKDEETGKSILYNEITGETKPINAKSGGNVTPAPRPGAGGKTELPTQTKVRQYNSAREIFNTRPDLAKHIKLGPGTNEFRIAQPGKNWFGTATGPTEEQVAEIETAIYGAPISQVVPQPTRTGKPVTTGVQNTPDGTPNRPPVTNNGPTQTGQEKPGQGNILVRTQTNSRTGEKRTIRSIDGGKTWEIMNAPTATR